MSESFIFWPKDIADDLPESPVAIVRTAASELGEATRGALEAVVELTSSGRAEHTSYNFSIFSRPLQYKYFLFSVHVPLLQYPVRIYWDHEPHDCNDAERLRELLKKIMSDPQTVRAVKSLLSQAASA